MTLTRTDSDILALFMPSDRVYIITVSSQVAQSSNLNSALSQHNYFIYIAPDSYELTIDRHSSPIRLIKHLSSSSRPSLNKNRLEGQVHRALWMDFSEFFELLSEGILKVSVNWAIWRKLVESHPNLCVFWNTLFYFQNWSVVNILLSNLH